MLVTIRIYVLTLMHVVHVCMRVDLYIYVLFVSFEFVENSKAVSSSSDGCYYDSQ